MLMCLCWARHGALSCSAGYCWLPKFGKISGTNNFELLDYYHIYYLLRSGSLCIDIYSHLSPSTCWYLYVWDHTNMCFCSSWNIEFSQIYPQFSLQAINKLEVLYCKELKWNLYISSSTYAKYYFALRSLTEKKDFRRYVTYCCNI